MERRLSLMLKAAGWGLLSLLGAGIFVLLAWWLIADLLSLRLVEWDSRLSILWYVLSCIVVFGGGFFGSGYLVVWSWKKAGRAVDKAVD
ncbi:hypothetical protein GF367_01515 [Candidatus Woesearchaeota archaeon]|nr:hypothetical protein [Candidatus Woesearchaeota archaeon]